MLDLVELERYTGPVNLGGVKGWHEHVNPGEVVVVGGAYGSGPDTIADSNREAIVDDHPELPYGSCNGPCNCLTVDIACCDQSDVDTLVGIFESLEEYPIYDEGHYFELEHARLDEYVKDDLPYDLHHHLELTYTIEDVEAWLERHYDDVLECFDGSVDDMPIDLELLAGRLVDDLGKPEEVA